MANAANQGQEGIPFDRFDDSGSDEHLRSESSSRASFSTLCVYSRAVSAFLGREPGTMWEAHRYVIGHSEGDALYKHVIPCDPDPDHDPLHPDEDTNRCIVSFIEPEAWEFVGFDTTLLVDFLDSFIAQWVNAMQDCCRIDIECDRAYLQLEIAIKKLKPLPLTQRVTILTRLEQVDKLPQSMKDVFSRPDNLIPARADAQSNVLRMATQIPTCTSFHPGDDNHEKLITYSLKNLNDKTEVRLSEFNPRLKLQLNTYYRIRADEDTRRAPGWRQDEWMNKTTQEFLQWMEELKDTSTKVYSEAPLDKFRTIQAANPVKLNLLSDIDPQFNGALTTIMKLLIAWHETVEQEGGAVALEEERVIAKNIITTFKITNGKSDSLTICKADINTRLLHQKPTSVENTLLAIQDSITERLKERKKTQAFFGESIGAGVIEDGYIRAQERAHTERDKKKAAEKKRKLETQRETDPTSKPGATSSKDREDTPICKGCGYNMRSAKSGKGWKCTRNGGAGCDSDARRNSSSAEWKDSTVGKAWAALGYPVIPKKDSITLKNAEEHRKNFNSGNFAYVINECNNLILNQELIYFSLCDTAQTRRPRNKDNAPAASHQLLLDTGAIGQCVVSLQFHKYLRLSNIAYTTESIDHIVSTAAENNNNLRSDTSLSFTIYLPSEASSQQLIKIPITAIVAPISVDLIIDKATIKEHNLVYFLPSHFVEGPLLDDIRKLKIPKLAEPKAPPVINHNIVHQTVTKVTNSEGIPSRVTSWSNKLQKSAYVRSRKHDEFVRDQRSMLRVRASTKIESYDDHETDMSYLATLSNVSDGRPPPKVSSKKYQSYLAAVTSNLSRKPAFEREGNLTDIPENKLESIPAELINEIESENEYVKVDVQGPPLLQTRIKALLEEFKMIFKSSVQSEPARLAPFKLEVDEEKWHTHANMQRCRKLDREREIEMDRLVKILIANKIIEPCNDSYYSHAFLVPKSNGKWRLVLDFKNLNSATTNYYKWPLPEIKEMLNRVGESRPEFFAVFDLTSGYYQAPIDEESRSHTAFVTRHGIYRWLRLPMGLTSAGSYFQHSLSTQVLNGLLHHGCELFLDDCMIHATTEDEYIDRLRTVFVRFRDSNITLNPSKCKLGLSQVEYVGHTINKDGLHFTRDKLDSVLNFPLPQTKRHIKSFIGLANYFRDHIKDHSTRIQLLQNFVNGYDKKQARHKIVWTKETTAAFEDIRQAIDECPMLWFLDEYSEIFLQTDASDYGIGAYLYQLIKLPDGSTVERPIGFISKSIASEHTSWDTPMKEGYAIFYALKKWEYLLRDREFTVITDHKNLTRLRADHDSNKMVKRWFMTFQEFDIKAWNYLEGPLNHVPDGLSRLCVREEDDHPATLLFQLTGYEVPPEYWDHIKEAHNTTVGHGGVQRTLDKLDSQFQQWDKRTTHVRRFIKLCPCCQKMNQMKTVIHSYPFTTSSYGLWETVSVDYVESLKVDEFGNNMIIVIIDNFSRFVDLYPCNSTNAEGAADALLSFVGRYGTPLNFQTDCGANFKSKLVEGLLKRLGSNHFLSNAYSKEINGIVERVNKEVLRHLKNIIFDRRISPRWSKYLALVQRILNTTKSSSTGLTPAEIVFPNGITLDKSILTESCAIVVSSYMKDLQEAQARIIALAEQNLRDKDEFHMETYSPERTDFPNGSYVLVEHRHNSLRRGPKSKLLPFLRGPMRVLSHTENGNYVLQDLVTLRTADYHMKRLRPFLYDERTLPPLNVAVTDYFDEFIAEKVIAMRGDTHKARKQLEFRIRWAGYGPKEDTWEPWMHCRFSNAVQTFLAEHPDKRVRKLGQKDFLTNLTNEDDVLPNTSEISDDTP